MLLIIDFANISLLYSAIGHAPIDIKLGYEPRTSFDWDRPGDKPLTVRERISREDARLLVGRL